MQEISQRRDVMVKSSGSAEGRLEWGRSNNPMSEEWEDVQLEKIGHGG